MIYLFGINSITQYLIYELNLNNNNSVILLDKHCMKSKKFMGFDIKDYMKIDFYTNDSVYVCIGYKNLQRRDEVCKFFSNKNVLKSFIHPSSFIHESSELGQGNIVMNNVFIDFDVNIGMGNIFWTNSTISHNVKIKHSCFFASGSIIGGYSIIDNYCFFGFNSSVRQKTNVSSHTLLNANTFLEN